jgi:hypothetical protein
VEGRNIHYLSPKHEAYLKMERNQMKEFIQMAVSRLGTSEGNARSAAGGILQFLQNQGDKGDFSELLGKVPGASDLLQKAQPSSGQEPAGGVLGAFSQTAGSVVGGNLGSQMGLMGILKGSGLDATQAGTFMSMFVKFLKEKAGADLIGKLLQRLPDLKKLVD